jgi:hypothetical protein
VVGRGGKGETVEVAARKGEGGSMGGRGERGLEWRENEEKGIRRAVVSGASWEEKKGKIAHLLEVVKVVDKLQVRESDRRPVPRQLSEPARLDEQLVVTPRRRRAGQVRREPRSVSRRAEVRLRGGDVGIARLDVVRGGGRDGTVEGSGGLGDDLRVRAGKVQGVVGGGRSEEGVEGRERVFEE